MNNQSSIINIEDPDTSGINHQSRRAGNQSPTGTLLQLEKHQICGFIHGSICPLCKTPNIINRSWRDDYLCGECFEVFKVIENKIHHLGNQGDIE